LQPKALLPFSQNIATYISPEPDKSSAHPLISCLQQWMPRAGSCPSKPFLPVPQEGRTGLKYLR